MTERSGKPSNLHRDGDRLLQLLIFNEEFLVSACHQRALITSLPFVHTARRSYRLNDPVRPPDLDNLSGSPIGMSREAVQTLSFRGRRSRNKVSVGEPAEGSLLVILFAPFEQRRSPLASESFMVSSEVLKRGFRAFVSWLFVLVRVSRVCSLFGGAVRVCVWEGATPTCRVRGVLLSEGGALFVAAPPQS